MRKLFAKLREDLQGFIEQRDDLMLLVDCSDADAALVLQTLRDTEQATGTDIFLLFADNFTDSVSFVTAAVQHLQEEHRLVCEGLVGEGKPPLAEMPAALLDATRPPAARLEETIGFARSLVQRREAIDWSGGMFPLEVADWKLYLQLISTLVPRTTIQPWMRGTRLMFRFRKEADSNQPQLTAAPLVRVQATDLGPAAMEASVLAETEDPELSDEERMQSLLSLAYLDAAHNRAEAAITKFNLLLGYYQQTGNLLVQAMVIKGLGDVAHRNKNIEQAQHWYECALPPAIEAKSALVLADLLKSLGDIAYQQKRFADAEQYYDGLDKLRAHLLDPEGKAQALEWRGLSQEKQQASDRAIASWEAAVQLCRSIGLPEFLRVNLGHLARAFKQTGMSEKLAAVKAELQQLKAETV